MDILKSDLIEIEKVEVNGRYLYVLRPEILKSPYKTVIFYHGWSSNAKNQIFRASILAQYGYQVVLPEALNHGERGNLDYMNFDIVKEKFLPTLMSNLKESSEVIDYVKNNLDIDTNHLYISGHSMGAITAGAVFSMNEDIKAAVVFNGTLNWKWLVYIIENLNDKKLSDEMKIIRESILKMNPMENIEKIKDRPIAMLNGQLDNVVSADSQEEFYNKALKIYEKKENIFFKKYENTYHQLTTQMLEDGLRFLKNIE